MNKKKLASRLRCLMLRGLFLKTQHSCEQNTKMLLQPASSFTPNPRCCTFTDPCSIFRLAGTGGGFGCWWSKELAHQKQFRIVCSAIGGMHRQPFGQFFRGSAEEHAETRGSRCCTVQYVASTESERNTRHAIDGNGSQECICGAPSILSKKTTTGATVWHCPGVVLDPGGSYFFGGNVFEANEPVCDTVSIPSAYRQRTITFGHFLGIRLLQKYIPPAYVPASQFAIRAACRHHTVSILPAYCHVWSCLWG